MTYNLRFQKGYQYKTLDREILLESEFKLYS